MSDAGESGMNDIDALMKRCQIGVSGYGKDLYYKANDLLAECYGALGRQAQRIRELEEELQAFKSLTQDEMERVRELCGEDE